MKLKKKNNNNNINLSYSSRKIIKDLDMYWFFGFRNLAISN